MTQNQNRIEEHWSLIAFARQFGRPQLAHCKSKDGEEFTNLAFTHPTNKDEQGRAKVTFAFFSSKLGPLSAQEVGRMRDELQVVSWSNVDENTGVIHPVYCVCKKGDPGKAWEDIDLGL